MTSARKDPGQMDTYDWLLTSSYGRAVEITNERDIRAALALDTLLRTGSLPVDYLREVTDPFNAPQIEGLPETGTRPRENAP